MQELHFSNPQAATNIQSLFRGSRLIPFFGTGFTKGSRSKNGRVPDATELTKLITNLASEKNDISTEDAKELKEISNLKTAFELLTTNDYIAPKQAQALLGNLFSEVKFNDIEKPRLLNLDWPHIFSFNIDDAIENTTQKYRKLIPNREVSREFINANSCLFKIHGDITEFISYKDPNLVFTWRDYAHSIDKNRAMLSFLEEQSKHSALLFLGCSLDAEIDLLHLSRTTSFSNSIYLKRGKLSISEKIVLKSYGIEQVIFFDTHEQICPWIVSTLKNVAREVPYKNLSLDDSTIRKDEAINVIANGGPLARLSPDGTRIGRKPKNFASRSILSESINKLRDHECIFITGRRFSGKTLFLFQIIDAMKHYGASFYASTDIFQPSVKKFIGETENSLFVFDSNYLNSQSLDEILFSKLKPSSKLIICSSSGDAEIFRFRLEARNIKFHEIKLASHLDKDESEDLNRGLTTEGLPVYKMPETLLSFAFRCYEEYKPRLKRSTLFGDFFDERSFAVMILVAAFNKAESSQIECFGKFFDEKKFIQENDRVFEVESTSINGRYVLVCNSPAWLISTVGKFIHQDDHAIDLISYIIKSLAEKGFLTTSRNLISFDKLNELGGGNNVHEFIRGVYKSIYPIYNQELHYWLQRAKCELISGKSIEDLRSGMDYASKVRLDSKNEKNQTYFSATLVMAQLYGKAYRIEKNSEHLLGFLDHSLESIRNYTNNIRHMDKMATSYLKTNSDLKFALDALSNASSIELLTRRDDINELNNFFDLRSKSRSKIK